MTTLAFYYRDFMSVAMLGWAAGNESAAGCRADDLQLVAGLSCAVAHNVQAHAATFCRILGDADSVIQNL